MPSNPEISLSGVGGLTETKFHNEALFLGSWMRARHPLESQEVTNPFALKIKREGECDPSLGDSGGSSSWQEKKKGLSFSFARSSASNYKCWRDQHLLC